VPGVQSVAQVLIKQQTEGQTIPWHDRWQVAACARFIRYLRHIAHVLRHAEHMASIVRHFYLRCPEIPDQRRGGRYLRELTSVEGGMCRRAVRSAWILPNDAVWWWAATLWQSRMIRSPHRRGCRERASRKAALSPCMEIGAGGVETRGMDPCEARIDHEHD
jgi:hypothetical protein